MLMAHPNRGLGDGRMERRVDRLLMPSHPEWQACNEVPVIYLTGDLAEMEHCPNISTSHGAASNITLISFVEKQEHGLVRLIYLWSLLG